MLRLEVQYVSENHALSIADARSWVALDLSEVGVPAGTTCSLLIQFLDVLLG